MKNVVPNLVFGGDAEEAFNFYKSVFGGEFSSILRYRDLTGMGVPEPDQNKIAHVSLPLGNGGMIMGSDTLEAFGKPLVMGNNFYVTLEPESAQEAERLFSALSAGGDVELPLQQTEWAEKFGQCADKFGVQWMLNYTGNVQFG